MTLTRADFIRSLCGHIHLERLAPAILESEMTESQIKSLLSTVKALQDGDEIHLGVVPVLPPAIAAFTPDRVQQLVHSVLADTVAQAIDHHEAKGRIQ